MLFMGEEWGARTPWQFFTHFPEPELREAVRDGPPRASSPSTAGATPRCPTRTPSSTFLDSKLDWDEPDAGAARHPAAHCTAS